MKRLLGHVHVDAGLLYLGDPCYVIDKPLGATPWFEFLERYIHNENHADVAWTIDDGTAVVCSTGYGDGTYQVYAEVNREGYVESVTVSFVDEDKECDGNTDRS
jgi:hypothetical protein